MACNASKLPIIRAITARGFSAQANPAACAKPAAGGLQSTVLPNKVLVSTWDNGSPVARITVAYKAGSRYEPVNEPGLLSHLRAAAGCSTSTSSGFLITRSLQQFGANLYATVDRETVSYTLEATQNNLEEAVAFLNDVASRQVFHPWEAVEYLKRIKYEIAGLAPQVRAMDLLHKAAYRRGLGNSLFCPPRQVGRISSESLQHYVAENFRAGRCSVSAVGLSLDRAVAAAQTLNLPQGAGNDGAPSPYKGGELRKEMGGELSHIALAVEGASLTSKDSLALAILSRAMAGGPQVKWGNDNSPLAKSLASATGSLFAVNAFNISYSDSGLFGVLLTAQRDSAGKATAAAAKALKSASSVGAEAIKRGRAQLICEVLSAGGSGSEVCLDLANQGVLTGAVKTAQQVADEIAKVSDSDVTSAGSKISKGRISMGGAGALTNVPYVDEL